MSERFVFSNIPISPEIDTSTCQRNANGQMMRLCRIHRVVGLLALATVADGIESCYLFRMWDSWGDGRHSATRSGGQGEEVFTRFPLGWDGTTYYFYNWDRSVVRTSALLSGPGRKQSLVVEWLRGHSSRGPHLASLMTPRGIPLPLLLKLGTLVRRWPTARCPAVKGITSTTRSASPRLAATP